MKLPRLGRHNWTLLSPLGSPNMLLVTVEKRHQRLANLGLFRPVIGAGLAIAPAGLRAWADAIEAGVVKDAQALADKRCAGEEAAGG